MTRAIIVVLLWVVAPGDAAADGEAGWIVLFDGTSTDAWRGYNRDSFPESGWVIEGGTLVLRPARGLAGRSGGDLITRRTFRDFDLRLEWKIAKGGNSGIFYHALEQPDTAIYWSALEMQILDDAHHPDSLRGVGGNRRAGALYDLLSIHPRAARPYGEWNEARIVSRGPTVEHWLNGERVLAFERWTAEWRALLEASKFRVHSEFGEAREGHIGLQDHGDVVWFRNIRIREL
jgi:hypothetical protein